MKELTKDMVTFTIKTEEELTPIRVALGEKATGTTSHEEYIQRIEKMWGLEIGWLWCCVKVTAKFHGLEGTAYLGQCAYESEEDFIKGGYYEQMQDEAFEELKAKVDEVIKPFTAPLLDALQLGHRELSEFYTDDESEALRVMKIALNL
jgi:hypothetical protein